MSKEAPQSLFAKACHPERPNENCSWSVSKERSESSVEYRRVDPPAAPAENGFTLLSVLKAAANYIILPEEMEQLSPGAREAIIKGLTWAIHEVEAVSTPAPAAPDERDKAAFRTVEQLDGSVATFADTDWCSECHAYTHKPDCRSARLTAKTLVVDRIVDAVYRSMAQYEDGTWFLDNLKAKARVNRLLATVRADVWRDAIEAAKNELWEDTSAEFGPHRRQQNSVINCVIDALESARGKVGG